MVWMEYLLMHCLVTTTLLLDQIDTSSTKNFGTVYFAGNGYGNIFTILPALAVGCTGKGRIGVNSRFHWAIRLG